MGVAAHPRPWPPPDDRPWVVRMRWHDLLFMHWPVAPHLLRPHIPATLQLDTFDGKAWLGVVPFLMDIRPRWTPPVRVRGLTRFLELNVRTYVTPSGGRGRGAGAPGGEACGVRTSEVGTSESGTSEVGTSGGGTSGSGTSEGGTSGGGTSGGGTSGGKPGVWFFSLDAASALAVPASRRFFHLPYFHADMTHRREDDAVRFTSVRTHLQRYAAPSAAFAARYRPTGAPYFAQPGTLDYFLTERYCLYAAGSLDTGSPRRDRLLRCDIHHPSWSLQPAACEIEQLDMTRLLGMDPPPTPPLLHFAQRQDVRVWLNQPQ